MASDKKPMMHGVKAKRPATAKKPAAKEHAVAETRDVVTVDRRDSVNRNDRRRQIDPTTCERDYTIEEVEFMGAMDNYKRRSGRMFPTCSEVLEVLRSLGYAKQVAADPIGLPNLAVSAAPMPMETPVIV